MRRAKIFMKVDKRGRNAAVSNAARVPLTPLIFNKIRGGLFIRNFCHFGIYGMCRFVSNHVEFYSLLTVHLDTIVLITSLTHFFNVFISLLYMFQATQCSSSGE
jgi:hypothetical protein